MSIGITEKRVFSVIFFVFYLVNINNITIFVVL